MQVRLQKYIADCGITSRRKAEILITQGVVEVNGEAVTELGTKVNPASDIVTVEGQVADLNAVEKIYLVMNKPRGYVTTTNDPQGRKTVMDLCQVVSERVYPVGRLDYLSEGLLILTNDGDVAHKITHPSFKLQKVYEVKIFGSVSIPLLKKLSKGVQTEVGFLKPTSVRVLKQLPTKTWLEFRLEDGKNREIRRLCEAMGLTIDKLKRVALGNLSIENLAPGNSLLMTKNELLKRIGMDDQGQWRGGRAYFSPKKTVKVRDKKQGRSLPADNEFFEIFRKEKYYETVKTLQAPKSELQKS